MKDLLIIMRIWQNISQTFLPNYFNMYTSSYNVGYIYVQNSFVVLLYDID